MEQQHSSLCRARCSLGHHHHPPPPVQSQAAVTRCNSDCVLTRIEQMDSRLKQLEEKQSFSGPLPLLPAAAPADQATTDRERQPQQEITYAATEPKRRSSSASTATELAAATNRSAARQTNHTQRARHYHNKAAGVLVCGRNNNKKTVPPAAPVQLSSAVKEMHLKGTLLERLRWLEGRIVQLSLDLDNKGDCSASSSTSGGTEAAENGRWHGPHRSAATAMLPPPSDMRAQDGILHPSRMLMEGPRVHGHPRTVNSNRDIDMVKKNSLERRVSSISARKDDKRRMARTRLYKRWFPVSC